MSERPRLQLPQLVLTLDSLRIVLPYSLIFCAIGITETVLTLQVLDKRTMTTGSMTSEIFGQGVGNLVGGFLLSTQGGCAMIVPSCLNVTSGGRSSLSVYVCATQILLFIFIASPFMGRVPVAALVAVLANMCVHTFDWGQIKLLFKLPKVDAVSTVTVAVLTVMTNLAAGVATGICINALAFVYQLSFGLSVDRVSTSTRQGIRSSYRVKGKLFWGNAFRFERAFEDSKDSLEGSTNVQVSMEKCEVMDQSAVAALDNVQRTYAIQGIAIEYVGLATQSRRLVQAVSGNCHV
jgi:SulP family sulfate permease